MTGGDYLKAWVAAIIADPYCRLPYLFFFGPENSGKSIFHEAVGQLFTSGVVPAERALTKDFNGELEGAIVGYVEELNISKNKAAHEKIKNYVTSPTIAVRRMRTDSYDIPNTTHWVQCANSMRYCPVFPGDTRITAIRVRKPTEDIPKDQLLERLNAEAPYFLRSLIDLRLPPAPGRLRVPAIETNAKQQIQESNESPLEAWLADKAHTEPGHKTLLQEVINAINDWIDTERPGDMRYTRKMVRNDLPAEYEVIKDGTRLFVEGLKIIDT